ncbi:MAG: putative dsRNA-binding protein, partial [Pleurocapsa sp.]
YRVRENKEFKASKASKDEDTLNHRFIAEVWLKERFLGKGYGRSKKVSEQAAAQEAFFSVRTNEE